MKDRARPRRKRQEAILKALLEVKTLEEGEGRILPSMENVGRTLLYCRHMGTSGELEPRHRAAFARLGKAIRKCPTALRGALDAFTVHEVMES